MPNEIEFIELLPKTGDYYAGEFKVGDRFVKIGITDTLVGVWNIQRASKVIELFLKQFGPLKIMLMLAEDNLKDYNFVSYDYEKVENGMSRTMTLDELDEYLKLRLLGADEKKHKIGFRAD